MVKYECIKKVEEEVKIKMSTLKYCTLFVLYPLVIGLDTTTSVLGSTALLNNNNHWRVTDGSFCFNTFRQTLLFGSKEVLSLDFSEDIDWIADVDIDTISKS